MPTFGPEFESLDSAFVWVLAQCLQSGVRSAPRGIETLELFPVAFSISDPRRRYVSVSQRRWSIVYALGEFCWHLRGSSSVEEIAHYAPRWRKIAAGDTLIDGSNYGARIFRPGLRPHSQWDDVINLLRADLSSRRAILYFANPLTPSLASSRDVACAVSLQFLIREGRLDAIATMRSNDAMLGLPYDVFFFSMLQEMAATSLGVQLGRYHHVAGSLHLYESSLPMARDIIGGQPTETRPMPRMSDLSSLDGLLHGEVACRSSRRATSIPPEGGYWLDLLSVIQEWSGRNTVRSAGGRESQISDPVLAALYSLRY